MTHVVGIIFVVWAALNGWRTIREVQDGVAYLVLSAGGDGLFGEADREDNPFGFWFNVSFHWVLVFAAAFGGLWLIFRSSDS